MKSGRLITLPLICAIVLMACGGEEKASARPPLKDSSPSGGQRLSTLDSTPTAHANGDSEIIATPQATITAAPVSASSTPDRKVGPIFNRITTSSKGFTISDCSLTSITVTASIADTAGVAHVLLWYRVGTSQAYTSVSMNPLSDDDYSATVKGLDMPRSEYGVWEFYITAEDWAGNVSQSLLDTSVQFLPCVGQRQQDIGFRS